MSSPSVKIKDIYRELEPGDWQDRVYQAATECPYVGEVFPVADWRLRHFAGFELLRIPPGVFATAAEAEALLEDPDGNTDRRIDRALHLSLHNIWLYDRGLITLTFVEVKDLHDDRRTISRLSALKTGMGLIHPQAENLGTAGRGIAIGTLKDRTDKPGPTIMRSVVGFIAPALPNVVDLSPSKVEIKVRQD